MKIFITLLILVISGCHYTTTTVIVNGDMNVVTSVEVEKDE